VERDAVTAEPTASPQQTPLGRTRGIDTVLGVVAAVLLPLGLLVIGLGWYGASRTPYLFEQIPYLISGGLIGLGLVLAGGLVFFGSWIARGAADQQRASQELAGLLREIRDGLQVRPTAGAPAQPRRDANGQGTFVATAHGSMLHRPDCSVVVGREDLRTVSGEGSGLQPCGLCDPLSSTSAVRP
jgi:hypothetical protein